MKFKIVKEALYICGGRYYIYRLRPNINDYWEFVQVLREEWEEFIAKGR